MPVEVGRDSVGFKWCVREWEKERPELFSSVAEVLVDPLTKRWRSRSAGTALPASESPGGDLGFVDPLGSFNN